MMTNRSFQSAAKLIAAALILFCTAFLIMPREIFAKEYSRRNYLRTAYTPDAYTVFEINGNRVTAVGVYKKDRIRRVTASADIISAMSFQANGDGSFEASFTLDGSENYTYLRLEFNSGAVLSYMVMNNGSEWYFPDNGLSVSNRNVFEHIYEDSGEAVGYYLSSSGEAERIAAVQQEIRQISDSVTEGIDGDYEKARALAAYVSSHYYYDHDARETSVTADTISLDNMMRDMRSVCTGFANLYCALLQAQGIDAVNIKGGSTGGGVDYDTLTDGLQNHEFTAFWYKEENRWVWVDSCWNGSGDYNGGEYTDKPLHEKYFDISDEALSLNHRADYAERRAFFGEFGKTENTSVTEAPESSTETEAPESSTETEAPESSTETEAPVSETTVSEETATTATEITTSPSDVQNEGGDVLLYIIAAVLGTAIIILTVYIVNIFIKMKKQ